MLQNIHQVRIYGDNTHQFSLYTHYGSLCSSTNNGTFLLTPGGIQTRFELNSRVVLLTLLDYMAPYRGIYLACVQSLKASSAALVFGMSFACSGGTLTSTFTCSLHLIKLHCLNTNSSNLPNSYN